MIVVSTGNYASDQTEAFSDIISPLLGAAKNNVREIKPSNRRSSLKVCKQISPIRCAL